MLEGELERPQLEFYRPSNASIHITPDQARNAIENLQWTPDNRLREVSQHRVSIAILRAVRLLSILLSFQQSLRKTLVENDLQG